MHTHLTQKAPATSHKPVFRKVATTISNHGSTAQSQKAIFLCLRSWFSKIVAFKEFRKIISSIEALERQKNVCSVAVPKNNGFLIGKWQELYRIASRRTFSFSEFSNLGSFVWESLLRNFEALLTAIQNSTTFVAPNLALSNFDWCVRESKTSGMLDPT